MQRNETIQASLTALSAAELHAVAGGSDTVVFEDVSTVVARSIAEMIESGGNRTPASLAQLLAVRQQLLGLHNGTSVGNPGSASTRG